MRTGLPTERCVRRAIHVFARWKPRGDAQGATCATRPHPRAPLRYSPPPSNIVWTDCTGPRSAWRRDAPAGLLHRAGDTASAAGEAAGGGARGLWRDAEIAFAATPQPHAARVARALLVIALGSRAPVTAGRSARTTG